MWIWHEVRTTGRLWRRQGETLILEPASTPHYFGLAQSLADGFASRLAAGQSQKYHVVVRPFSGSHQVRHVNVSGNIEFQ
ncbi:MAG: hypothetical protein L0228_00735 [Planctomycetes bacterium]|nr:hypothetical protein [Planctomycetota bacterium]